MKKLQYCLLIPLAFLAKTSIAQDSDTRVLLTPSILSASSLDRAGPEGLSVSIGSLSGVFILEGDLNGSQEDIEEDSMVAAKAVTGPILKPEDYTATAGISIYPNPFIDRVSLSIKNFNGSANYHFRLMDLMGIPLAAGTLDGPQEEIALNSIPGGIYVLQILKNEKEITTFKLIQSDL